MALPAALAPLRHPTFRMLWIANVVTSLGTWFQNTGAGWLMTSLSPDPLTVSLVPVHPIFTKPVNSGLVRTDVIPETIMRVPGQTGQ